MPALRVAIDLTALEHDPDRPASGSLAARFAEALINHAPAVTFNILTRPRTRAALAHLEGPNATLLTIAAPSRVRSVLARLRRRVGRSRFKRLHSFLAPKRGRPGVLARQGVHLVFCPFTGSGFTEPALPLVLAVSDLQHLSHPFLLGARERAARRQASSGSFRRAARIVCSTPSLREVALQCDVSTLGERILTVAPGRLLAHPAPTRPAMAATLARHGLTENQFMLLVADFEPRHNHRVVLTALAMLRARHPDSALRLVCVGGPQASVAGFQTVADQMGLGLGHYVHFAGVLDAHEISALIQGCAAVLVPSVYETVGETVLEAMQLERPVLCSRIPELAELTGTAAVTFDPHRPAELAAALEWADRDPANLSRGGRLGRERVAAFDDAQGVAEAYLGVFREALTSWPPSR